MVGPTTDRARDCFPPADPAGITDAWGVRRFRWLAILAWTFSAGCGEETPAQPSAPAPAEVKSDAAEQPTRLDAGVAIIEALPLEPLVRLGETKTPPAPLPAFAPGVSRELVFEVRLQEKRSLYVPVVRLRADTAVVSRDAQGAQIQWTPGSTELPNTEGADPEFVQSFLATLTPTEPTSPQSIASDAWASANTPAWPAASDPHTTAVASGLQLALSHLSVVTPPEGLSKGARWTVQRTTDLFGVPTWERIEAQAKKIDGNQLEVKAKVFFTPPETPASPAQAFGQTVTAIDGEATLHARFDLVAGLPVDMQLRGSVNLLSDDGKKKPIRFEIRADENYMAAPDPRVTLRGELTDGGLVVGKAPPGTTVWFNKAKLPVSEEGDFVFGFGRQAPPRALLAFSFDGGPAIRHILHVSDRTFEPEAIDGLPDEYVNPDKETKRALAKSRKRIKKIRAKVSKTPHYRDGFEWPAKGRITSTYGRKRILNGEEKGVHWGIDIAGRVGKPVKAPAAGVVVLAEQDVPLSGNLIIVDHGHGLTSSFLHLQKLKVKVGDAVKRGQTIGTLGNTGRSTGPHLDWRMNLGDTRVDPQLLVPPR